MENTHLLTQFEQQALLQQQQSQLYKARVAQRYGSVAAYLDQLDYGYLTSGADPAFDEVYALYASVFAAGEGPRPKSRFLQVLGQNNNLALRKQWGHSIYAISYARDPQSGQIIGGSTYITFVPHHLLDGKFNATQNGNYLFVTPEARALGLGGRLVQEREIHAQHFLASQGHAQDARLLVFNQQNNPYRLSMHEYLEDNLASGMDQFDRIQYWQNRGFRRLDFDYIELGASDGVPSCRDYTQNVKAPDCISLSAEAVLFHVIRLNAICRKDGQDPRLDREFAAMCENLEQQGRIKLLDDRRSLPQAKAQVTKLLAEASPQLISTEPAALASLLSSAARRQRVQQLQQPKAP